MFKLTLAVLFVAAIGMIQASPVRDTPTCETCKLFATVLQTYLKNNSTEQQVLNFLDANVCASMGALEQLCVNYINTNVVAEYETIANMDPAALCGLASLCPGQVSLRQMLTPDCNTCQSALSAAKAYLAEQSTENEVEGYLESTCQFCPAEELCKSTIEKQFPAIYGEVLAEMDPAGLCKYAGFCPASLQSAVQVNPLECRLCETVITTAEAQLGLNNTEAAVVHFLEDACQQLPANFEPTCLSFVEVYTPYIVELLIEQLAPAQICKTIKLC